MSKLDHEKLMAFVDGELEPKRAAEVGYELLTNPEAAAYVRDLYELNKTLKRAVTSPEDTTSIDLMAEKIRAAGQETSESQTVVPFRSMKPRFQALNLIAASLVGVVIGIGSTSQYVGYVEAEKVALERQYQEELAQNVSLIRNSALEYLLSGESETWVSEASGYSAKLTPIKTMVDGDRQYCREYVQTETYENETRSQHGVACRTGQEKWDVRYLINKV